MNQTKIESFFESILNIGSGFFISLLLWIFIVVPLWNLPVNMIQNFVITGLFTITSIIRSYFWRRFFNAGIHKWIHKKIKKYYPLQKKDFIIDWFSGSGSGGQHRNKHQNCCRITHIESGLVSIGTESKSRVKNQKNAFERLVKKIIPLYINTSKKERYNTFETIRTYHAERNDVIDTISKQKLSYKQTVGKNDIDKLIKLRKKVI